MTVYGVNGTAGLPVASTQNLNVQNVSQPVASAALAGEQKNVYEEPQKSSSNPAKVLLYLGAIGALTYAFVRYKNIQAMKPVIQNFEKATKDGGKLTTQVIKTKTRKLDGKIVENTTKSIKTYFDKDGHKRAEIIHNISNHERYSVYYDKDGNITKNVVSRMSVPAKNGKAKLEQKLTNVFTRNNNGTVTTTTTLDDFYGKNPVQMFSFTKTESIPAAAESTINQH